MTDGKKEKWNFETDFDTFRQKNLLSMFVEKHYNFIEKKKNEGLSLSDIFEVAEGMGLLKGFSAKQFENKFSYLRGKKTEPSDEKNGEKKKKTNKKKNKDSTPAVESAENAPNVAENPAENAENLAENPPISAENPAENAENPAENPPSLPENPPTYEPSPSAVIQQPQEPDSSESAKKKYENERDWILGEIEKIFLTALPMDHSVSMDNRLHNALCLLPFNELQMALNALKNNRVDAGNFAVNVREVFEIADNNNYKSEVFAQIVRSLLLAKKVDTPIFQILPYRLKQLISLFINQHQSFWVFN